MKEGQQPAVFGKRRQPHTVIIARGDRVRHFTVRPWAVAIAGVLVCILTAGYLLATSYLFFRDDLIAAAVTRESQLRQSYEGRIAALRTELDRVTSRQLIDQQLVEKQVAELLRRQDEISQRHGAAVPATTGDDGPPVPTPRPDREAGLTLRGSGGAPAALAAYAPAQQAAAVPWPLRGGTAEDLDLAAVSHSLRRIETAQVNRVDAMTEAAYEAAADISDALEAAGLADGTAAASDDDDSDNIGGPYLPPDRDVTFDSRIDELDDALARLDTLKKKARSLPLRNPAPGHVVTSPFGVRRDPFLGKRAFHAGMDFRLRSGSTVRATAPGMVTRAGWAGGYGRMVEIDNGDGITTRFGHLSSIGVTVGQKVAAGTVLGKSGSSGRSTGPHLHYEIRKDGRPVDPLTFLTAGRRISRYL